MSPTETRALLVALRTDDHAYLGIRPADATPTEAPCILVNERTVNAIAYALITAAEHWPSCSAWALIASDAQLQIQSANWPPRMVQLRMPSTIATFSSAAAVA